MKAKYFFILAGIYFTSCCHEVQCTSDGITIQNIELISFTKSETESIVLIRFTKGSNFVSTDDSLVLDSTNCTISYSNDTTIFVESNLLSPNSAISSQYDYEVLIPATNTLAKIDNIQQPQTQEKSCPPDDLKTGCFNYITSYRLNGKQYPADGSITINK